MLRHDSSFDTLSVEENISCMPSITFDCVDIVNRLKKLNVNKSEGPKGNALSLNEFSNINFNG